MLIFGYPTNDSAKTCHISYNSSQANKMLFHTITESSNHTVKSPKRDKLHERNLSVLHSNKIIALPATTHPFPLLATFLLAFNNGKTGYNDEKKSIQ